MRRRDFLKTAATGFGLVILPKWARGAAPSDKIRLGIIGAGGIAGSHVGWFLPRKDVTVDAIADVDNTRWANRLKQIHAHYRNTQAKGYQDFRRILDRPDIDAVTVATPDHWHALNAILAFQAGKDVYGEKPMAWSYREAQAMVTMCHRYQRVFQLGTQVHAGENYHRVVELVRSGRLGKIHTVRVWFRGRSPVFPAVTPQPVPAQLDYDMWLGPAPWRPYHPKHVHYNFRFFWPFCNADYSNFYCHIADPACWACNMGIPIETDTRGEEQDKGTAETCKWIDATHKFADGLVYHFHTNVPKLPGIFNRHIGARFEGSLGTLSTDYSRRTIIVNDGTEHTDFPDVPKTLPRSHGHQRNFLDCIRTRGLTDSNIDYAFRLNAPMLLSIVSYKLGRPIRFDPAAHHCIGDPEANRLLDRVMRAPWTLPV